MTPEQRFTLKLVALCLQYPSPGFADTLAAVAEVLPEVPADARLDLAAFVDGARALTPIELESRYARAFDFQKDHALYLTFQELGEVNERATELVAMKELIFQGGFEPPQEELPDYIPLLLEFLAEKFEDAPDGNLPARISAVLVKIAEALEPFDPLYVPVLRAALAVLPEPGDTIKETGGQLAEEDKDVPYPMDFA